MAPGTCLRDGAHGAHESGAPQTAERYGGPGRHSGTGAPESQAADYGSLRHRLMEAIMDSWARISEGADLVVVEGAGSPAEINLRDRTD